MTFSEINEINLVEILSGLGVKPEKSASGKTWFLSPFRGESSPSFCYYNATNSWYDWGLGEGGGVVDFIIKYHNVDINGVKDIINHSSSEFAFRKKRSFSVVKSVPVLSIKNISDDIGKRSFLYLHTRGITVRMIKHLAKEITVTSSKTGKSFSGVGFENDKGGFELRNNVFKGTVGEKDVTTIKNGSKILSIFEGFLDLFSLIVKFNSLPRHDVIVLNSTTLKNRVNLSEYDRVHFWGDNDTSGEKALKYFDSRHDKVVDMRFMYKHYNDINDWLNNKKIK